MKILVGCPTFKGYSYCIEDYLEGVKNLSLCDHLILIDNSEDMYSYK